MRTRHKRRRWRALHCFVTVSPPVAFAPVQNPVPDTANEPLTGSSNDTLTLTVVEPVSPIPEKDTVDDAVTEQPSTGKLAFVFVPNRTARFVPSCTGRISIVGGFDAPHVTPLAGP